MNKFRPLMITPICAALVFAGTAQAHTKLVASTPAANATVVKPTKITLTFSEKIVPAFSGAELVMTAMPGMATHDPMKMGFTSAMGADGKTMTLLMKRALTAGMYKLSWHAGGADTHRMTGDFSFTVK
jgi:methionine-rich copper-binding protein CopC